MISRAHCLCLSAGGEGCPTYSKKRRNANWIGQISRRNYLLEQVIAGNIEGRVEITRRRVRRRKQLLDGLKKTRGCWKLQALGRTVWRTRFGKGCGSIVKLWNEWTYWTAHRSLAARTAPSDLRAFCGGWQKDTESAVFLFRERLFCHFLLSTIQFNPFNATSHCVWTTLNRATVCLYSSQTNCSVHGRHLCS